MGPSRSACGSSGKERLAMSTRQAKMCGDAGTDVGERRAPADGAAPNTWAERENRNAFARVITTGPGRNAAVVAGDDGDIVVAQRHHEIGKPLVEGFERGRITRR